MADRRNEPDFSLHGIGWTTPSPTPPIQCHLETPRLLVRSYRLDDAAAVFDAINASRDHLRPWMPWANAHRQEADTVKYIAEQVIAMSAGPLFTGVGVGIFDRFTGEFLGGTGVHDVRAETASCETGYWIRADRCGLGYATEACRHILSWVFTDQCAGGLGLRRVRIFCSSANTASRRIPEKLGLHQEVHQREDIHVEYLGPTDRLGWGVMAREWDTRTHRVIHAGAV